VKNKSTYLVLLLLVTLTLVLSACTGQPGVDQPEFDWKTFRPYAATLVANGYTCGPLEVVAVGACGVVTSLKFFGSNDVEYLSLVGQNFSLETILSFQETLDSLDLPDC